MNRAQVAVLLATLAVAAGCARGGSAASTPGPSADAMSVSGTTGPVHQRFRSRAALGREHAVAARPSATPAQVFAAGHPGGVAADADGSLLVTWTCSSEDDEGPEQTAWRTFDPAGRLTGQGRTAPSTDVAAAGRGFVLFGSEDGVTSPRLVTAASGSVTRVGFARDKSYPRAGDVLLEEHALQFWRPSDGRVHTSPHVPGQDRNSQPAIVQGSALSASGAFYAYNEWDATVPVVRTTTGGRVWSLQHLALPGRRSHPTDLLAGGSSAVVPVVTEDDQGDEGARVLYASADSGRSWYAVHAASALPLDGGHTLDALSMADDGRLLAGDEDTDGWWLAHDASNRSFTRLPVPPTDRVFTALRARQRIYAVGAVRHLWYSDDQGRHWRAFDTNGV